MKLLKYVEIFYFLFAILKTANCQDSVFSYPTMSDVQVKINVKIVKDQSYLKYHYRVKNLDSSRQSIWQFRIQKKSKIEKLTSPFGWNHRIVNSIYDSSNSVIRWSSDSSKFDIRPDKKLSGFAVKSISVPSIGKFYITGFTSLPVFDIGDEPSQIVNNDILENSFNSYTIIPNEVPEFNKFSLIDSLISYCEISYSLSWIKKSDVLNKFLEILKNAKRAYELSDFDNVYFCLFKMEKSLEVDQFNNLSNEAYALLKYNTEFLIENLTLPGADEMFDRMLQYINEFFDSGEIRKIRVRNQLIKIIEKSEKHYESNKIKAARNSLNEFKRQLRLYRKEKISNECYEKLMDYADFILYALK